MASKSKQGQTSGQSRSMEDVAHYIEGMRFRKKLFGGVDEADVWKKIEALHKEYEAVFLMQELRHEQELRSGQTRFEEPQVERLNGPETQDEALSE